MPSPISRQGSPSPFYHYTPQYDAADYLNAAGHNSLDKITMRPCSLDTGIPVARLPFRIRDTVFHSHHRSRPYEGTRTRSDRGTSLSIDRVSCPVQS
jgi:hypothetical protein